MNAVVADNPTPWRAVALVLGGLAAALGVWGFMQWQQANTLQGQVTQLQQRLTAAAAEFTQVAKPDLPLTLSFRPAMFGSGMVAVFRNNGGQALELAATFSSPATGQRHEAQLVIPAGTVKQYGSQEGWSFAPGHQIILTNERFRTAQYVVP